MAARSDALIGHLQRTASIIPASGDMTVCLWVRAYGVTPAPGSYRVFYAQIDAPGTYAQYAGLYSELGTNDAGFSGDNGSGVQQTAFTATTLSQWYHLAWVQSGTSQSCYVNGSLTGSCTLNRAAVTVGFEYLLNDTFSTGDVDAAYCRQWTAALTADQIQTEMQSTTAVLNTGLYMDCPLEVDALDISGFGHDWTTVGAVSYLAQPTFPSNSSIATATAVSSVLPQTFTQDFGDGLYAWFSYTAFSGQNMLGAWAFLDLSNDLRIDVTDSDGAAYLGASWGEDADHGSNSPLQIPVTAGQTIYLKAFSGNGLPPTGDVTISLVAGPSATIPIGSIFVNDDFVGFRTGAVSATDGTNYSVLNFFPLVATHSEQGGDVLANGRVLMAADDDTTFRLYNGQFTRLATISTIAETTNSIVRTCVGTQTFFVAPGQLSLKLYKVGSDGTVATTWTLTAGTGVRAMAPQNDEATVYIVKSSGTSAITPWDTAGSSFGANLVAAIANRTCVDLLVLGDDSIVALYVQSSPGPPSALQAKRYDATGVVLNSYTLPSCLGGRETDQSCFHAIDDPTSFWLRLRNVVALGTCTFYNIKASDGTVLATITQASYEVGIYQEAASASPSSRFGLSTSCPAFILREAIMPPAAGTASTASGIGDPVEYLIRRERIFPVISKEQHRLFFSKLQLYFEAGVGLSSGQGSDPIVELDWSDDGGHTWSNLHLIQTGKQGQFTRRAMKWNMGSARERLYRVAVTDPVQWTLIDAFIELTEGLS